MKSLNYYKNFLMQRSFKELFQMSPALYVKIQLFRYRGKPYRRKIVTRNSDIVIEGYPRSANSFSVKAFMFANGDSHKIATHQHVASQVIMGVRYNIPTLVLIRHPFDCISSYAALRVQNRGLEKFRAGFSIRWMIQDYISFYKKIIPYRDQFVLGKFSDVLNDYGAILEEVNAKYNANFIPFEHSSENVKTVFDTGKQHLSPSKDRNELKTIFAEELRSLEATSEYKEALRLYNLFTDS